VHEALLAEIYQVQSAIGQMTGKPEGILKLALMWAPPRWAAESGCPYAGPANCQFAASTDRVGNDFANAREWNSISSPKCERK
jgi:hypothetical protein